MTHKQVKSKANQKLQDFKDKEAGIDRKKLSMDRAVEALERSVLKKASLEVSKWPKWLQLNASLLFEEEQERQKKLR